MKKIFYILCLMAGLTAAAQAQGTAPLTVQEVDGSPKKNGVTKIIVSNGTLTCTGTVCTIVTGGGGGLTIGATAIASGTAGRILYEAAANVLGETAGFSYQPATSPNLTITAQAASYVGLRINSAATPSNDIFQVTVNGTANSGFIVTSTGSPDSPWGGSRSIRYGSNHTTTGTVNDSVVFGNGNSVSSNNSIAIGTQLTTSAAGSTNNIYIGWNYTNGNTGNTIAIGKELTPGWAGLSGSSIILGIDSGGAVFSGTNNFIAGTSPHPMTNIWFGKGVTNATPTAYTINGTGGSGTNIAGADINIAGGKGTGTGATGKVNLQIARPGSTGSSLNALATAWSLNGTATSTNTTMTGGNGQTTVTGSLSESVTLSTSGTTTDSTIDLPANSIILSVTGRVTTTITTATDWKLGDATISDRFSDANATLTAGTTTVGINQWKADRTTAGQGAFQQSTAKVRITTTGTPGAGVIRITVHYITLTPPTS